MTVVICYHPDVGYCISSPTGQPVCAVWFGEFEVALEYCKINGWDVGLFDDEEIEP